MVNFHDPKVIEADAVALEHFTLILDGIFLWEFFSTLDFEWNYLIKKKKLKWPFFLYLACRICSLGVVICYFITDNITRRIACQPFTSWNIIFVAVAFGCASSLVTIRVIAIWNYNYFITAVAGGLCLTDIVVLIYGAAVIRGKWSDELNTCALSNTDAGRYTAIVVTVTDVIQLIIMLVGLMRNRRGRSNFIRHLYTQGLVWLAAVAISEVPSSIFMFLNLNVPWDAMFQMFNLYTMVICATRMYRSLISYDMDIHKYSQGPGPNSTLRFVTLPRIGMAAGTGTGTESGSGTTSSGAIQDSEIMLAEMTPTPAKDDSESHKAPIIVAHDEPNHL